MEIVVDFLSPSEWRVLSKDAHLVVFNEAMNSEMERIDYALIARIGGEPAGYVTVRELDAQSVYWHYGGAFPGTRNTVRVLPVYSKFVEWTLRRYRRIKTRVENTNRAYLKLAMHVGFQVVGFGVFKGTGLVELLLEEDS